MHDEPTRADSMRSRPLRFRGPLRASLVVILPVAVAAVVGACKSGEGDGTIGTGGSLASSSASWSTGQTDGVTVGQTSVTTGGECVDCQSVTKSPVTPPPLSGGTLFITRDGSTAVVADPDRDRVVLVDLDTSTVKATLTTPERAEPGRAAEDANGLVHVVLRAAGAILTIDPTKTDPGVLTPVCEAPRGIAASTTANQMYVACASGELLALDTSSATPKVTLRAVRDPDQRDLVLSGSKLFVSHLRSASIDIVDPTTLAVTKRVPLPEYTGLADSNGNPRVFSPTVAWRMIANPDGGVSVVHQHSRKTEVVVDPNQGGGYASGDCNGSIVHTAVAKLDEDGALLNAPNAGSLSGLPVPVDVALSPDQTRYAIVGAGASLVSEVTPDTILQQDGCQQNFPIALGGGGGLDGGAFGPDGRLDATSLEPIAVAYDAQNRLVVQTREPSALEIHSAVSGNIIGRIELGGETRFDTGYLMFHSDADFLQRSIACASCHPEGREDGHTWTFNGFGARRTQSLASGIAGTEPLHWDGSLPDVAGVMSEVFVKRMGGFQQDAQRIQAITDFIDSFPHAPKVFEGDDAAVQRGKTLFEDATVGCTSCHKGDRLTNNDTVDVGTGAKFQVPSLTGVGARAPFMHDGCAATLEDRFSSTCGGAKHGDTSALSVNQIEDLVAYLKTL